MEQINKTLDELKLQIQAVIKSTAEQRAIAVLDDVSKFVETLQKSSFKPTDKKPISASKPELKTVKKPQSHKYSQGVTAQEFTDIIKPIKLTTNETDTKTCARCNQTKPVSEFQKSGHKGQYRAECKACTSAFRKRLASERAFITENKPQSVKIRGTTDPNDSIGKRHIVPHIPNLMNRLR